MGFQKFYIFHDFKDISKTEVFQHSPSFNTFSLVILKREAITWGPSMRIIT